MAKAATNPNEVGVSAAGIMNAFEKFVRIQADAALRQVAGQYAYDSDESGDRELTLRDGRNRSY